MQLINSTDFRAHGTFCGVNITGIDSEEYEAIDCPRVAQVDRRPRVFFCIGPVAVQSIRVGGDGIGAGIEGVEFEGFERVDE